MRLRDGDKRGVAPVIGVVLMVGIVVAVSAIATVLVFGIAERPDVAPIAQLEGESGEGLQGDVLVHGGGERIQGDRIELRGASPLASLEDETLRVGSEVPVYPWSEVVRVVWHGERGSSYVLAEVEFDGASARPPDERCDWVAAATDGHVDPITVDGKVVDCPVETEEQVTVRNGGVVIGDVVSDTKELDADDATVVGGATVGAVLNVQNGSIGGDAISRTADVKLDATTVEGSVRAQKVAEVAGGSVVDGSVRSTDSDAKVLQSTVRGPVTADGIVKLDDATVTGHVYVEPGDFDCTDSTIRGQDCGSYAPRDPDDW